MPTDPKPTGDAYLDSIVERTLATYRALVPPDVLEVMRELVVQALTEDEVGRDLLERARPRKAPEQSDIQPVDGAPAPAKTAGGRDG
jgi:hypothetical protein